MNKKVLAIVFAIIILVGAGAAYLFSQKKETPSTQSESAKQSGNVFSSIQDALAKKLSLKCIFTDTDTNKQTTAYISGGLVRADIVGNDKTQQYNNASVIVKDKKMYFWDNDKKQGMTMDLTNEGASITPTQSGASGSTPQNAGDVMAALEKYKNDCKPAIISDALFTPPTDVKFTDLSQMMKQTQTQAQQQVSTSPAMNQQQIQQMMQQYQNQAPTQ
ncbi:MAG: hypothetical protein ACREGI_03500 [Candidatus Levyibacteriota bacterium]